MFAHAQAKIDELDCALGPGDEAHVIRLDVAVDDLGRMHKLERIQQLGRNESQAAWRVVI